MLIQKKQSVRTINSHESRVTKPKPCAYGHVKRQEVRFKVKAGEYGKITTGRMPQSTAIGYSRHRPATRDSKIDPKTRTLL